MTADPPTDPARPAPPEPAKWTAIFLQSEAWPGPISLGFEPNGFAYLALFGQGIFHFLPTGGLLRCWIVGDEFVVHDGKLHLLIRMNPPFSDPEQQPTNWMPPPGYEDVLGGEVPEDLEQGFLEALRNDLTRLQSAIEQGEATATGRRHSFAVPLPDGPLEQVVGDILAAGQAADSDEALDCVYDWVEATLPRLGIG